MKNYDNRLNSFFNRKMFGFGKLLQLEQLRRNYSKSKFSIYQVLMKYKRFLIFNRNSSPPKTFSYNKTRRLRN